MRYYLFASVFYFIFHKFFKQVWLPKKVNPRNYNPNQLKKELKWSTISSIIFAFFGTIAILLWQNGLSKVYLNVRDYPIWYLPVSLLILLFIHETYYYWLHRWMHLPKVFRIVHKVHHESNISSPFTAFSFHPLEGLTQAIFLPLLILILPLHIYVILVSLIIMTISSFINHLDIELFPKNFNRHFIGKWLIGATHHSLHHSQFKYNYGLYFTFWDRIKKTESDKYDHLFDSLMEKKNEQDKMSI